MNSKDFLDALEAACRNRERDEIASLFAQCPAFDTSELTTLGKILGGHSGDFAWFEEMLKIGYPRDLYVGVTSGESPLIGRWARHGNVRCVEAALKHGWSPNLQGRDGKTALHSTLLKYELENKLIIKNVNDLLFQYGGDATVSDSSGLTANDYKQIGKLHYACKTGDIETVNTIIIAHPGYASIVIEIDKPTTGGMRVNALQHAALWGFEDIVRLLLKIQKIKSLSSIDPNASLLFIAAEEGHKDVVRLLVAEFGASLGILNENDLTPLMIAVREDRPGSVKELLDLGADVNQKEPSGLDALDIAVETRCTRAVFSLLVRYGALIGSRVIPAQLGNLADFSDPYYVKRIKGESDLVYYQRKWTTCRSCDSLYWLVVNYAEPQATQDAIRTIIGKPDEGSYEDHWYYLSADKKCYYSLNWDRNGKLLGYSELDYYEGN
jgi:ankyrin repeat protein